MNIKKTFPAACAALLGALLLGGCAISVTHNDDGGGSSKLVRTAGMAKFECVQSPSGQCHYALYTSRCQSVDGEGGKPATTCTHQVFEQFSIASGETRSFSNLPANYKQCMKPSGKPEVPSCG